MRTIVRPLMRSAGLGALLLAVSAATAAEPAVAPEALAALDKMGKALHALGQFNLVNDMSTEVVLDDGQKVELQGTVTYRVQQPDKAFIELRSDRRLRQLFYDGQSLTLWSPRLKYYARADDVGKTLGEVAVAAADYGIEFPLADLFFWGTGQAPRDAVKAGLYVGAGTLGGERVDQYAFRQEGVDWQVWIAQATSLPVRLVITSLEDEARPRYTARLHWDTKTPIAAGAFTFEPPADAARLQLVAVQESTQEP